MTACTLFEIGLHHSFFPMSQAIGTCLKYILKMFKISISKFLKTHLNLVSLIFMKEHGYCKSIRIDRRVPQSDSRPAKYDGSNGPSWPITAIQFSFRF